MSTSPPRDELLRDRFRPLAGGAPDLPWLWLGTWSLGGEGFGPQDAAESRAVVRAALDAGIRHVDTAGFYAHGRAEKLVADALSGRDRREVFLSTKGGLEWEGRQVRHRARPADLRRALHGSLRRLDTDYVDLFQLHWPDPEVPLEESLGALEELRGEGLVRFWGAGNLTAAEVRAHLAPQSGIPHQVPFNPVRRADDVLAAGSAEGRCLNCVVSPFEQGLLGDGRGSRGLDQLGKRDARHRNPRFRDPDVLAWVADFERLADRAQVARPLAVLLWIVSRPDVHVVVPGPRTVAQLGVLVGIADRIDRLGLGAPDGGHHARWRTALESALGPDLWAHLHSGP